MDLGAAVNWALTVSLFVFFTRRGAVSCAEEASPAKTLSKVMSCFLLLLLLRISCELGCLGVHPSPPTSVSVGSRQRNKKSSRCWGRKEIRKWSRERQASGKLECWEKRNERLRLEPGMWLQRCYLGFCTDTRNREVLFKIKFTDKIFNMSLETFP